MNIAGIDISLASMGLANVHGETYLCKTKADDPGRLRKLYGAAYEAASDADLVVIEDLPTHAMSAGLTGRAQGVVRMAIYDGNAEVIAISAASLKKFATGSGKAKKPDMRKAWLELTGVDNPRDDEVDAGFLRMAGLYLADQIPQERAHWDAVESFRPQVDAIASGWELS